ncbi:hypothetical protein EVAR_13724_1 [Eumeta japonica]|uniref:Uncharacterized protein n=1 Tax=Eumeta variegata TaxID=151549 RepID=A0A4C1UCB8_EUMVA|nr:hypothetical protein EVAR_13724_1 [Eumeta japonica]
MKWPHGCRVTTLFPYTFVKFSDHGGVTAQTRIRRCTLACYLFTEGRSDENIEQPQRRYSFIVMTRIRHDDEYASAQRRLRGQ